jgi:hypothetical protein
MLASGSLDGTIVLWDVNVESWLAHACMVANRNLTDQEWRSYFGEVPYKKICPDLPAHPSVIERALGEANALHQKGIELALHACSLARCNGRWKATMQL